MSISSRRLGIWLRDSPLGPCTGVSWIDGGFHSVEIQAEMDAPSRSSAAWRNNDGGIDELDGEQQQM